MGLLVQAVRGDVPGIKPGERLRAAETILDRGHGRAVQAVISVPSRQKLAAVMSAMSDEALMQIARRGEYPPNEGPNAPGEQAGPIQASADPSMQSAGNKRTWADAEYPLPRLESPYSNAIDAEFIDPNDL